MMTPRAVAVVHTEALAAEGIASALAKHPAILSIGFGTTARDAERLGERADAMAIDVRIPDAVRVASKLRGRGVRVVFLGEPDIEDESVRVPVEGSVSLLARALVPALADVPRGPSPLTKREQEILALVANGLAGKQVARHLGISAKTVEQHKTHIFTKLGVPNQTAAVSLMLGNGLGNANLSNSHGTDGFPMNGTPTNGSHGGSS